MGHLRSVEPVSRDFGTQRGRAIDRYYIEDCFLEPNAADIRGRVLEIGDATYTRRFGGNRVTASDVLHAVPGNAAATIVGDLSTGVGLDDERYDCVILTQVLLVIYDLHAAISTIHRILAPGGVALVTVPGISQIARNDMNAWGDYWRFTEASARRLFEENFSAADVGVTQWGNVLTATCFLQGIAFEELTLPELDHRDPDYPVTIGIAARKARPAPDP
ncbi:MAG TPA: methyltransferase domain-containing protein [Gemmatimonas sp.]|nr:methyltransferase domain-containing protein [Gemmatimonas sp.]